MRLIFRYLWNNLFEKKGRTLLVILSIAIASALVFANEGFSRTIENKIYEADTRFAGNADYLITPKDEVGSAEWIDEMRIVKAGMDYAYAHTFIVEDALYMPTAEDAEFFDVYGVKMQEWQQHNPFDLQSGNDNAWSGQVCVMGSYYAEKLGFSDGDTITLEMNGNNYDFVITGIASPKGVFLREQADGPKLFVPKDTLQEIYGGSVNLVCIKLADSSQLDAGFTKMTDVFTGYNVSYAVNQDIIEAETANYVMPFRVSSIIVVLMCFFIIYTGFGLIMTERISSVGTIRSLGGSKKKLNGALFIESGMIGAAGGLLGCLLGIGVLALIKSLYDSGDGSFAGTVPMIFGLKEILFTLGTAVAITLTSAAVPIVKTTSKSVKDIILSSPERRVGKVSKLWIPGLFVMAACIIVPQFLGIDFNGMIISCVLSMLVVVSIVFVAPAAAGLAAKIAERFALRHEVCLGIRNVKDNAALANNLKLYSALIALVIFMSTIFNSMAVDLQRAWDEQTNYDVEIVLRESDLSTQDRMMAVDGVSNAVGYYVYYDDCEYKEGEYWLNSIFGITGPQFFDMKTVSNPDEVKAAADKLPEANNVIVTTVMQSALGLQTGDVITLKAGDTEMPFTVIGFAGTNYGIGRVAYISAGSYRELTDARNFDCFMVTGSIHPDRLKANIKRAFVRDILSCYTTVEGEAMNADKVDSIFNSIMTYTYIAIGVGLIGIVNNVIAGFLKRKRSIALFRCSGMSQSMVSRMLLTEAVVIGTLGCIIGSAAGFVMTAVVPQMVGMFWGEVEVVPDIVSVIVLCTAGIVSMFAISLIPLKSSGKISIMENMKYE